MQIVKRGFWNHEDVYVNFTLFSGLGALPPVSVPCEDGAFGGGGGSSPGDDHFFSPSSIVNIWLCRLPNPPSLDLPGWGSNQDAGEWWAKMGELPVRQRSQLLLLLPRLHLPLPSPWVKVEYHSNLGRRRRSNLHSGGVERTQTRRFTKSLRPPSKLEAASRGALSRIQGTKSLTWSQAKSCSTRFSSERGTSSPTARWRRSQARRTGSTATLKTILLPSSPPPPTLPSPRSPRPSSGHNTSLHQAHPLPPSPTSPLRSSPRWSRSSPGSGLTLPLVGTNTRTLVWWAGLNQHKSTTQVWWAKSWTLTNLIFIAGPTSPHTPTTLPDIYIQDYSQDWTQECEKGLLDRDFVDTLREGLEPIDDQLMAELTRSTGTFVDPAVEEQFKMNY